MCERAALEWKLCERGVLQWKMCERGVLEWKMCERAVLECLYMLDFVPDPYKTQGMCKKVILEVLQPMFRT